MYFLKSHHSYETIKKAKNAFRLLKKSKYYLCSNCTQVPIILLFQISKAGVKARISLDENLKYYLAFCGHPVLCVEQNYKVGCSGAPKSFQRLLNYLKNLEKKTAIYGQVKFVYFETLTGWIILQLLCLTLVLILPKIYYALLCVLLWFVSASFVITSDRTFVAL